MTQLRTWITTLMAALLAAALAHGCSIGGDEPWEDEDDDSGGDTDSDSDSDVDSDSDADGDTEGMDLSAADGCNEAQEVDVPGDYYGDTSQATNLYAGSCASDIEVSGPDLVLAFYLETAGTFSAALSTTEIANPVLYLRDECGVDTTELSCMLGNTDGATMVTELEPGDYSLFIDGDTADDVGEFTLSLALE